MGEIGDSGGEMGEVIFSVPGVVVPDLYFQGWSEMAESAFLFLLFRHVDVGREYESCFRVSMGLESCISDSGRDFFAREYVEALSMVSPEAEIASHDWRRARSMSSGSHENEGWYDGAYDGGREVLFSSSTSDAMIPAMMSLSLDCDCTGLEGVCEGFVRSCIVSVQW
jgi:hypothetical protein